MATQGATTVELCTRLLNGFYSLVHQVGHRLLFLLKLGQYVALLAASRITATRSRARWQKRTCCARSASYFATACCGGMSRGCRSCGRVRTLSSTASVSRSLSLLAGLPWRRCALALSHSS